MMHIAMADAVVAIDGRYEPLPRRRCGRRAEPPRKPRLPRPGTTCFSSLITTQAGRDAAAALLQSRLVDSSARPARARRERGQEGRGVDPGVASERWIRTANPLPPAYLASTLPGIWRATASGPYQFSEIGNVAPFGLLTVTQFLPVPFPQLESAAYAENVNEVKKVGRNDRAAHRSQRGTDAFRAVVCGRRALCRRHERRSVSGPT